MAHNPVTGVLKEEGSLDIDAQRHTMGRPESQGECHVTTEAEVRVMP